ncbi:hypothetical protein GX553_01065 [Candidatus Peribacteria bacterium]|nr:hypothetical protein [Candidatus Peribacteria bacterium]
MLSLRKHIRITAVLACIALVTQPVLVHGNGATIEGSRVAVSAADTVAGLGTEITISHLQGKGTLTVFPPFGMEITRNLQGEGDTLHTRLTGQETQEAGTYDAILETENGERAETAFTVMPEQMDIGNSAVQAQRDSMLADGQDTLAVRVILRDRYGNPLEGRAVTLISSETTDTIAATTEQTDDRGEQAFSVHAYQPGERTLRAVDLVSGRAIASQLQVTALLPSQGIGGPIANEYNRQLYAPVQPSATTYGNQFFGSIDARSLYGQVSSFDVVDSFILDTNAQMHVNTDENLTITAVDRNGRVVEDYTGTVELLSTDPQAILPSFGNVTFRSNDLGRKTLVLGLRFATPGEHVLHARDSRDRSIMGEIAITVAGDTTTQPRQTIKILSPAQDAMVNNHTVTVEGTAPPFVNLVVTGGTEDVYGESDTEGYFSIAVPLHPNQQDHTLRVRDESGRNDSGNLRLKLDIEPPSISKFTFTPVMPTEGDEVLVSVQTEDNSGRIATALLHMDGQQTPMEPGTMSGAFQILLRVEKHGSYQPMLQVADAAGNTTEMLSTLEVRRKGLPQVQNVQAEAEPSAIVLSWDPVEPEDGQPIDGYRIYVGENAEDFPHTLETDAMSAKIGGLKPGVTYYFALTAWREDQESTEKSKVVQAIPIGMRLNVTPGNSSLTLQWTKLKDVPLASFRLEYGVEPENYTEERMINGALVTHTMRDLLNDITYYIRLTPIATTGETLTDLAVTGEGTPTSKLGGFQPGPADPVPTGLAITANPPPMHSGAPPPAQPETGIPVSLWWILAIALPAAMLYLRKRRSARLYDSFVTAMQQQYTEGNHV